METMFEAEWIVDDTMPDGDDFDPALCEYGLARYKTIEAAINRAKRESEKSPMEWFTVREYEKQHIAEDYFDWELVATWDECGDRWPV